MSNDAEHARLALVTCATLPDLDPDDRLLLEPLHGLGVEVTAAIWDDPTVDWAGFDLAVIRSTWDYPARRDVFLDWTRRVPRLANPADVIVWNTDKRYLADLAAAGIPIVPTTLARPYRPRCASCERSPCPEAFSRCRLGRRGGVLAARRARADARA